MSPDSSQAICCANSRGMSGVIVRRLTAHPRLRRKGRGNWTLGWTSASNSREIYREQRSAKPLFVGSIPTRASNYLARFQ
jgi:hypothetical protein